MTIRTIIEDDLGVYQMDINDDEISAMLDSGFVSAVLRTNDDGLIEYANVDWNDYTIEWTAPEVKTYE